MHLTQKAAEGKPAAAQQHPSAPWRRFVHLFVVLGNSHLVAAQELAAGATELAERHWLQAADVIELAALAGRISIITSGQDQKLLPPVRS